MSLRTAVVSFLSMHGSRLYADRLNREPLQELSRALGSADAQVDWAARHIATLTEENAHLRKALEENHAD